MEKNNGVIVSAVRTPFGKFSGTLRDVLSIELGAMAIREVLPFKERWRRLKWLSIKSTGWKSTRHLRQCLW
jgi:hypothetical protein